MIKKIFNKLYTYYYKINLAKSGKNFKIISPILFSSKNITIGDNVFIRNNCRIEAIKIYQKVIFNPSIVISNNVTIEQNLHLTCANCIEIGEYTSIASNVTISDITHPYENILIAPELQNIVVSFVKIGKNCKIFNNSVILPGVTIGKHCIIGANSVVTKDIPDYSVAVGAPAKVIKRYNFNSQQWERVND